MSAPVTDKRSGFDIRDLKSQFGGGGSLKQFGTLGALVAIIIIFQVWTGGKTLQADQNAMAQSVYVP